MIRVHPDPPLGDIAQLVEHLLCKQGVASSSLVISTIFYLDEVEIFWSVLDFGACPEIQTDQKISGISARLRFGYGAALFEICFIYC